MEILDILSTVLELSQNRENYGDEMASLTDILVTLQMNLKKLSIEQLNNIHNLNRIQIEIKKSQELLQSLPKRPGMLNVLASKLPGSALSQLKDQREKLVEMSQLLSQTIMFDMLPKPSILISTQVEPDFVPTLYDPDIFIHSEEDIPYVQLTLRVESSIKEIFLKYNIQTEEVCHMNFNLQDYCEVFKFQRSQYQKMVNDLETIKFISRDHAIINCKRTKKEIINHKPSSDKQQLRTSRSIILILIDFQKPQSKIKETSSPQSIPLIVPSSNHNTIHGENEVFHSLQDELFLTCQEINEEQQQTTAVKQKIQWNYQFELKNLGQMGTFIYKNHINNQKKNNSGQSNWQRLKDDELIQLNDGDQIAILMQKSSNYKLPLLSYMFKIYCQ